MKDIPDGLAEILENPRIVKVGVGIQYDAKKLYKDLGVSLNSCVDLSLFVKCVDSGLFAERLDRYTNIPLSLQTSTVIPDPPSPSSPRKILKAYYSSEAFLGPHIHRSFRGSYNTSIGLARLAKMYTEIVLTKGKITRSNWEAPALTEAQLAYAALDAYAGYIVYAHLVNLYNLLSQKPMRRFYAFDCIRGTLYHCSGDTSRTLLAQRIEDSDYPMTSSSNVDSSPVFRSVEDEISLHVQGIGEDQHWGLVPWTQSNPEYDTGPMPPLRTEEEKKAARIARQKKKEERIARQKKKEESQNQTQREEGGNLSGQMQMEVRDQLQRNATENVTKSIAPNAKPQQQLRSGYDATKSAMTSVTMSTQAAKVVQPPRAPTVSQANTSALGWRETRTKTRAFTPGWRETHALTPGWREMQAPTPKWREAHALASSKWRETQGPTAKWREPHALDSDWRKKQKPVVANTAGATASDGIWKPSDSDETSVTSMQAMKGVQPPSQTHAPASQWRAKQKIVVAELDALPFSVSNLSGSDDETSVTTSLRVRGAMKPPKASTVSRTHVSPSEQQGKSEAVVMTTVGPTASTGVWKPSGKDDQKRLQTKPQPGPSAVSHPTTSGTSPVATSTPAPKKKGKKLREHPQLRGYGILI